MGRRFLVAIACLAATLVATFPALATGKLGYTEVIATDGTLTLTFNAPAQKNYMLNADASATWQCSDGTTFSTAFSASNTATAVPGVNGQASVSISLEAPAATSSNCTQQPQLQQIAYTNVMLTNLATGHVYPLDVVSQTFL